MRHGKNRTSLRCTCGYACRVCPIKTRAACATMGVRHVPWRAASYTKDVRGQAALCGCKQKMPRRLNPERKQNKFEMTMACLAGQTDASVAAQQVWKMPA